MNTYDLSNSSGHDPKRGRYKQTIEIYLSPIRARQEDGSQTVTGLMLMAQDISKAKEMDGRLHAALAELQVIIDNTMLGMILLQDGRIVRINTTFEYMFSCPFAEIKESAWPVFYSSVFAGKEAECWDGSGRMYFMTRKAGTDGEEAQPFWCKVRRVAIDDEQQETRRELLLFEDMSSQNEMFEKIQRLSQAVEQSSNSVVITDTEGIIEYVNRTFVKLTGYQAGEVIGRSLVILSPDEKSAAAYEAMRTAALAGQEWTGELVNRKKNGDLYEENVVVSPIRNEQNEITHFVVTKENITDLKKARQQADAANKAKSEFLANMSHEIRTPMNSIIGMTELLLDTALLSEQRGYLENVNSSASVLLSLINDILDFSKIEAGRLELDSHPFSIRHLAEEIIATLKILAEQKGIELRLILNDEGTCSLLGDSLRIRQVLLNLVGNAIKFTRKGYVALEIDVHPAEEQGFCAADFRIIDTGIGIAKEQQEKIFADFTQADSSITRDYGGTGLGLSISSRLLQMMGSKIELESELGKGSIFSYSLLLENGGAKAAADMRRQEEVVNPMARRLDILLVEDNPANQQLAVILLVKQGHQVTVANSGAEALVYLSKYRFDLIFMDMQMPVMDGLTATRHIRNLEQGLPTDLPADLVEIEEKLIGQLAGSHLHIIAVTANALQEDRQQCLDAGMDEYLSKPYKKISMLRVLQRFDQGSPALVEQPEAPPAVRHSQKEIAVASLAAVKQHIMKQFELEQNDAEEVLAAYSDSLKENLGNLHQLLENGQGTEAGRQAHALKGSLLNLGLESLAQIALALEKELPKQIETRHWEMAEQLARALKELTA
jgi:two-component system sensor histidine kinase/response regulator